MEELLSKIYDKVVCYEDDSIVSGKAFDQEVTTILKPLTESMSESEIEQIRELMYDASYYAGKDGFMLGVRFVIKLLTEVIVSPTEKEDS